jgi:RNA polymerase sigma factor (sigma-70 family)|nr:MAG TPA: DNA directed RNA polymerase subunit [Caudoviricetes sp.]
MTAEELYLANEPLVYYTLKKLFPDKATDEDIKQVGRLGLWKACVSYDKDTSKFSTYACNCIRNELIMHMHMVTAQKRTLKDAFTVSLDQEAYKSGDLEGIMLSDIVADDGVGFLDLKGFWESLIPIERAVVRCKMRGMIVPEIVEELGISHTTVWRYTKSAREKWDMYI